jgi:hypothetical protein
MARTTTRIRNENHGTSDTDEEERYAQNYAARSNEMNVNGKRKSSDGADDEGPAWVAFSCFAESLFNET